MGRRVLCSAHAAMRRAGEVEPSSLDVDRNLRPTGFSVPHECGSEAELQRLSDSEVQQFIVRGVHVVQTPFGGAPVHATIERRLGEVIEGGLGNPGNNLLAAMPEIAKVFEHPAVRGAVESLLGPGAFLHPHCHCHDHQPGAGGQSWHKDEYNYDANFRSPRQQWIFALYYPQEVVAAMGPTCVLPQYQHISGISSANAAESVEEELPLVCPAGSVALVNFDCWHRASANTSTRRRYMCKFHYVRVCEPGMSGRPTWNHSSAEWQLGADDIRPASLRRLQPMVRSRPTPSRPL
jgi:hypothetical protein